MTKPSKPLTAIKILKLKFKDNLPVGFNGKFWDDKLIEAMEEYANEYKEEVERLKEENKNLKDELFVVLFDLHNNTVELKNYKNNQCKRK